MSIPEWIKVLIIPIITDLQADELLQKCPHGETQNNNEGLNSIIWSRVPKSIFVSKPIIEMGTYSNILHFNDGTNGLLQVLDYCNMSGKIPYEKSLFVNVNRVKQMKRKSSEELGGGGGGGGKNLDPSKKALQRLLVDFNVFNCDL